MSRYNEILQKVKWESLQSYLNGNTEVVGDSKEIAAKLYAEECVKASLEKASENGLVKHSFPGNSETSKAIGDGNQVFTVDKQSITNTENIILL